MALKLHYIDGDIIKKCIVLWFFIGLTNFIPFFSSVPSYKIPTSENLRNLFSVISHR